MEAMTQSLQSCDVLLGKKDRARGGSILSRLFLPLNWRVPHNHLVSGAVIIIISSLKKESSLMKLLETRGFEHSSLLELILWLPSSPPTCISDNIVLSAARLMTLYIDSVRWLQGNFFCHASEKVGVLLSRCFIVGVLVSLRAERLLPIANKEVDSDTAAWLRGG